MNSSDEATIAAEEIEALKKALERERAARIAAEDANRAKDEFLAVLSHELRTPLNAMYGWVRMFASGSLDAAMQRRAIEVIERNINLQIKLIEDVLDIARIASGKIKLDARPLDLIALVESIIENARPAANQKNIQINFAVETEAPLTIAGDAERLHQIFNNLIDNAIKFTGANGRVGIQLARRGDFACARISDTGVGIEPTLLPFVFERFRQAAEHKRKHSGLGLGLAIVKSLVEMHNGTVTAASDGENQGATFTVELPL